MIAWLGKIITWIISLWSGLPDSTKEKIIDAIVDGFSALFRNYYQSTKNSEEPKDG